MDGKRKIDICLSPALFPFYRREGVACVVVDVFRATTCMCAGLAAGVASIIPVADIDEAERMKRAGYVVAAERNVAKCSFADLGNSPFDYMRDGLKGKEVVMTTTNGTQALVAAKECEVLVAGAFVNLSEAARFCKESGRDVLVLCAGWNNRVNLEDTLFGGALAERLLHAGGFSVSSDATAAALSLWRQAKGNMDACLNASEHAQRLLQHGLKRDMEFCLTLDAAPVLPLFDKNAGRLLLASGF